MVCWVWRVEARARGPYLRRSQSVTRPGHRRLLCANVQQQPPVARKPMATVVAGASSRAALFVLRHFDVTRLVAAKTTINKYQHVSPQVLQFLIKKLPFKKKQIFTINKVPKVFLPRIKATFLYLHFLSDCLIIGRYFNEKRKKEQRRFCFCIGIRPLGVYRMNKTSFCKKASAKKGNGEMEKKKNWVVGVVEVEVFWRWNWNDFRTWVTERQTFIFGVVGGTWNIWSDEFWFGICKIRLRGFWNFELWS